MTSGIDYTIDPDTGLINVGARRLSLRSRKELVVVHHRDRIRIVPA